MDTSTAYARPDSPLVKLSWRAYDSHRWVTLLAGTGLAVAVLMALFGLPPIDLHPPFHYLGIMDPLCGGTRSARFTARGDFVEAWKYNPLGILVVAGAVVALVRSVLGFTTERWATIQFGWTPRRVRVCIGVVAVLLVILEVRQQSRADLLLRAA